MEKLQNFESTTHEDRAHEKMQKIADFIIELTGGNLQHKDKEEQVNTELRKRFDYD